MRDDNNRFSEVGMKSCRQVVEADIDALDGRISLVVISKFFNI
jgi:hypothetical protein